MGVSDRNFTDLEPRNVSHSRQTIATALFANSDPRRTHRTRTNGFDMDLQLDLENQEDRDQVSRLTAITGSTSSRTGHDLSTRSDSRSTARAGGVDRTVSGGTRKSPFGIFGQRPNATDRFREGLGSFGVVWDGSIGSGEGGGGLSSSDTAEVVSRF